MFAVSFNSDYSSLQIQVAQPRDKLTRLTFAIANDERSNIVPIFLYYIFTYLDHVTYLKICNPFCFVDNFRLSTLIIHFIYKISECFVSFYYCKEVNTVLLLTERYMPL